MRDLAGRIRRAMQSRRTRVAVVSGCAALVVLVSVYSLFRVSSMDEVASVAPHLEQMQVPWAQLQAPDEALGPSQINRHFPSKARVVDPSTARHAAGTIPLAIMKLPRTGSSWFTEVLNKIPSVYISKEIMQQSDKGKYTNAQVEDHLIQALTTPKDKVARMNDWLPSGRFKVDYLDRWKFLYNLDILGFTLNPLHAAQADYSRLAKEVPNLKLVVLTRTNNLKMALSGVRGQMLHRKCGISNLKAGMKCSIPSEINWPLKNFTADLDAMDARTRQFMDVVYAIGVPVYEITYEDLQTDEHGTMAKLFAWLGKPELAGEKPAASGDGWVKRTSDSLKNALLNYDEIEQFLTETDRDPSGCYLRQLRAQEPISLPPCHIWMSK